jgi:hypothetical protein
MTASTTSRDALTAITPDLPRLEAEVLDILRRCPDGLTDEEGQELLEMEGNTYRPRRIKLVERGLVVDAKFTRKGSSGRAATVWMVAPKPQGTWKRTIYRLPDADRTCKHGQDVACGKPATHLGTALLVSATGTPETLVHRFLCEHHAQEVCDKHGMALPQRAPQVFLIPPGTPMATCSSCRDGIRWIVTQSGKRMPVNLDGTSHFTSCPCADQHRKGKA